MPFSLLKKIITIDIRDRGACSGDGAQFTFEQDVAALMLLVAMADDELSEEEIETIKKVLCSDLKLSEYAVAEIIENVKALIDNSADIYGFVRDINKNLKQDERQEIVRMLWKVVFADKKLSNMEDNIMRKICNLLGIDRHTYVYLKDEVKRDVL